jgi:hypothetical protein
MPIALQYVEETFLFENLEACLSCPSFKSIIKTNKITEKPWKNTERIVQNCPEKNVH